MAVKLEEFFVEIGVRYNDKRTRGTLARFGEFFKALPGLTIAGVGVTRAFQAVSTQIADTGDRIAKTAAAYGITGESLQRLEFAAERSRVPVDALRMALSALPKRLDAARLGSSEAAKAFADIGLSASKIQELSPDEQFKQVAGAIAQIENPAQRSAAALRFFEESGARLIPLFNQGPDGINRLGDELEALGGIIDEETLKASEEFSDRMLDAGRIVRGLLANAFKVINPLLKRGLELFIMFRKDGLGGLPKEIRQIVGAFKAATIAVAVFAATVAAAGVAAKIAAAGGIAAATRALLTFIGVQIAALAPIILVAGAVTLLALVFEDLFGFVNGKDSLIGLLIEKFDEMSKSSNHWIAAIGKLGSFAFGGLGVWLADVIEKIETLVDLIQNKLLGFLGPKLFNRAAGAVQAGANVAKTVLSPVGRGESLSNAATGFRRVFTGESAEQVEENRTINRLISEGDPDGDLDRGQLVGQIMARLGPHPDAGGVPESAGDRRKRLTETVEGLLRDASVSTQVLQVPNQQATMPAANRNVVQNNNQQNTFNLSGPEPKAIADEVRNIVREENERGFAAMEAALTPAL